ncbi:MAG: hypothetical protein AAFR01_12170, partial [Pseudomonadota bacterium]
MTVDQILDTRQALAWLAERGVRTSRDTLDNMRAKGELAFVKTRGRFRIGYAPRHLAEAFLSETIECPSKSSPAVTARNRSTYAARTSESALTKALALAT